MSITLNTNLYKPEDYFKILNIYPKIKIIASYHSAFIKDSDEWMRKAIACNVAEVRLMMYAENKRHIEEVYEKYRDKINCYIRPIEQYERAEYGHHKHELCDTGFIIRENGDIMRCWSEMEKKMNYYNIYKEPIRKLDDYQLCEYETCYCPEYRHTICLDDLVI